MLRKNKKSKTESILLLLVVIGVALTIAYARYASKATSSMDAQVAPWKVSVNNQDIVSTNTFTLEDIKWNDTEYIAEGYIAPGRVGTIDIEIDPSGSKVAMKYKLEIDETNISNESITITDVSASVGTVTKEDEAYVGTFTLDEVEANTKKVLTITIAWDNPETETTDSNDTTTGMNADNFEVPIKITTSQLVE